MKKVIIIIILSVFLKPTFPALDYIVNYEYISTTLCENKAKPELKCNGKCYLKKQLAKASSTDILEGKPINSDKKSNFSQEIELLFCNQLVELEYGQIISNKKTSLIDSYNNLYFHKLCCSVFHPPTIFS